MRVGGFDMKSSGNVVDLGARRFMSVSEVATHLGVSIHTIYGMIYSRRLPFRYHKFGRRVLIDRREFERWAAEEGIAEA